MHRYLRDGRLIAHASKPTLVRRTFGIGKRQLAKRAQKKAGLPQTGVVGPALFHAMRRAGAYDALAEKLVASGAVTRQVPQLGPVVAGGRSMLDHDLTHATGGVPGYPAFDGPFGAGTPTIAPEPIEVTWHGRFRRRDGEPDGASVYATGASGIRYVAGHLDRPARVGARLKRGARVGLVSANHEEPHAHWGVDASAILGHELEHHTDYTHGAPTIRRQLTEGLMRS